MELFSLILNLVLGSGIVGTFIFYTSKRRKAEAEADGAEIHNEQTEVDRLEARLKIRDDKIDVLYVDYRKLQNDHIELLKRYHMLDIERQEAVIKRCDIRGCKERMPPSEY